jgi:hypothetical protein
VSESRTYAEAGEILGHDAVDTRKFVNRHHTPRWFRRRDVVLAKTAAGGRRQDLCVDPKRSS